MRKNDLGSEALNVALVRQDINKIDRDSNHFVYREELRFGNAR